MPTRRDQQSRSRKAGATGSRPRSTPGTRQRPASPGPVGWVQAGEAEVELAIGPEAGDSGELLRVIGWLLVSADRRRRERGEDTRIMGG